MATVDAHLAQWAHNRSFLQTIPLRFPDWIVTAAFYASVHAIEALLVADGAKARSRHQDRFQILQCEKRYDRIYRSYHVLYDLAHVTRYSAEPQRWVAAEQIRTKVISELLYPIENSVRKLLSERTPPVSMAAHVPIAFTS